MPGSMPTFKLFVSSPSDVMVERRRVENVVSRLNGEFSGVARLEAIRWETEFYQAYSTFQAQIPPSTACDLVIGILKWRLGTELPPDFGAKLPDGRPFPSGTAYEILTAIEQRRTGGRLPDVFVFRFAGSSPSVAVEDPNRAKVEHDWQVLKSFFRDWFLTEQGYFKAAFNPYNSEDDFEAQLEKLLRNWIADKVAGGRVVRWPIDVKGSPFRGLDAFGAKHAPVFFGRSHDTARAVDLWREAGSRGSPYLLVVGTSGSGKSSLARAGLLPRLTTPGVIPQVDVWRIAVMRPGDSFAGPIAALAAALMQDEAGLPKDEEGRGPGLPEIGQGDWQTPAELAAVLRHADAAAVKPVLNALARVGASERDRENYSRDVRCDLVLLIDQFEELFSAAVSEAERSGFVELLVAFAASGRIWVATTLRADFYPRMLGQPALKKLKESGATYDLAAPGPVELAEIVHGPAEAAGIVYETDATRGESLDAFLLRDADRPDMLPLLQLALARLYEGRETVGGEVRLTLKVYEALGGLEGIIDEAGEKALGALGEAEKARLPALLRQLAVSTHDQDDTVNGGLTIRAVPLAQAAPDDAARRLLDALVTARLLTTSRNDADAQVRLAHQRVLEDWRRARTIAAESADFIRIRADVEEQRRRWEAAHRSRDFLVGRGRPLAEAESIVRLFPGELSPAIRDFIQASRRRARIGQRLTAAAALVFAAIAAAASLLGVLAYRSEQRAERNFATAVDTANALVSNVAGQLRPLAGVSSETVRDILKIAETAFDRIAATAPNSPQLRWRRAVLLLSFVDTYISLGDNDEALRRARAAQNIMIGLTDTDPSDDAWQLTLAESHRWTGDVLQARQDFAGALDEYRSSLAIREKLVEKHPEDSAMQAILGIGHGRLGYLLANEGDPAGALAEFRSALAIREKLEAQGRLAPDDRRNIPVGHRDSGDMLARLGDLDSALAEYRTALDLTTRLAEEYSNNALLQWDISALHEKIGRVFFARQNLADALGEFQTALNIMLKVSEGDPNNVQKTSNVELIEQDIGNAFLAQGNPAEAIAAFQKDLDIARKLAAQQPDNAQAQRNVSVALNNVGKLKLAGGDKAAALAAYTEGLDITRKLAVKNPDNAQAQTDLLLSLFGVSTAADPAGARTALTEARTILEKLEQEQKLTAAQSNWPDIVRNALSKLP